MKITVPTDWKDIKLKQFVEIGKVPSLNFSEEDAQFKVLEILTGVSDEVFLKLPLPELKQILKKTSFIYTSPEPKGIRNVIKIKGQRYRVRYKANELTGGEYIDVQHYLSEGVNVNLHKILAVYLHPINMFGFKQRKRYERVKWGLVQTIESRKQTEDLIYEHMTMDNVFPISSFFLRSWGALVRATQVYLEKKVARINRNLLREAKKHLPKTTDGI